MLVSRVDFHEYRTLTGFSRPVVLEMETQYSTKYRNAAGTFNGLFVYTLKGRGCFQEKTRKWDLVPGVAYICCGYEPDVTYFYPHDATEPWTFFWLAFTGGNAEEMLYSLITNYGRIYRIPENHHVIRQMLALLQPGQSTRFISPHQGHSMVSGVLNMLAEVYELDSYDNPHSSLMQQAKQLILKRLYSDISCEQIARILGMSREHFSRLFKSNTGISPNEFIVQCRMIEACGMLRETNMSCKEIAVKLGYESASNFVRAFRKNQKMTPLEFRRKGALPRF